MACHHRGSGGRHSLSCNRSGCNLIGTLLPSAGAVSVWPLRCENAPATAPPTTPAPGSANDRCEVDARIASRRWPKPLRWLSPAASSPRRGFVPVAWCLWRLRNTCGYRVARRGLKLRAGHGARAARIVSATAISRPLEHRHGAGHHDDLARLRARSGPCHRRNAGDSPRSQGRPPRGALRQDVIGRRAA
jgi:hypothetical protein